MKTTIYGCKTRTASDVLKRPPVPLAIPLRELVPDNGDVIVFGFRQTMLTMGENDEGGGVDVGAGLGSDAIVLRWGKRWALVRGSELLKAWVKTFDPKSAERFPEGVM